MVKDTAAILRILETGSLELLELLPWSSNYTFLMRVCSNAGQEIEAVYKPRRGERPLWDFPQGTLCQRELAAFVVADAIGWQIVPPTVMREGPHGPGSLQLFIEHDPERHYFTIEGDPRYREPLQQIVLLDILINNADRKSGHILLEEDALTGAGSLWGIDHGVCFHTDYKLRSVIWEFAGKKIPPHLFMQLVDFQSVLEKATDPTHMQLKQLLKPPEIAAIKKRLRRLVQSQEFSQPGPGRHYPWPPV